MIERSLKNIMFTTDPLAGTYNKLLEDGVEAGTTKQADINGIFDLTALNECPGQDNLGTQVSAGGLGNGLVRPGAPAIRHQNSKDGTMPVVLENLGKRFGDGAPVLDDVNATIAQGEFVALLGASGCGKSTLLNIMAGLEAPTSGALEVPSDGAAFMFQDAALFPWLTARGNIELALKLRGVQQSRAGGSVPPSCWNWCTWAARGTSARTNFPAACGSALPWPVPWPRTGSCC